MPVLSGAKELGEGGGGGQPRSLDRSYFHVLEVNAQLSYHVYVIGMSPCHVHKCPPCH